MRTNQCKDCGEPFNLKENESKFTTLRCAECVEKLRERSTANEAITFVRAGGTVYIFKGDEYTGTLLEKAWMTDREFEELLLHGYEV